MTAFAANSLLTRKALGEGLMDAASFSSVRMVAGAITLCIIVAAKDRTLSVGLGKPEWGPALALASYMIFFSFAYVSLAAGTGALILFGAVQITMFAVALRAGEEFPILSWAGLALAILGLVYLVSPGITAPDPLGAVLMTISGVAWGVYSLQGRSAGDPLAATKRNFIYAVPLALTASVVFFQDAHMTAGGIALAIASGAAASGCGYAIWYAALRGLTASRAATVQLSVPVIAAFGGVVLLSEDLSLRLALASIATLGGVAIVLLQKSSKH